MQNSSSKSAVAGLTELATWYIIRSDSNSSAPCHPVPMETVRWTTEYYAMGWIPQSRPRRNHGCGDIQSHEPAIIVEMIPRAFFVMG